MDDYIAELNAIFSQSDKILAHQESKHLLLEMANDLHFMHSFMARFLENKNNLSKVRHHPVIGIPIEHNQLYVLTAHLWFPLPAGTPSMSHQSIHHHSTTLLTSVAPFGEGYESVLFKKNWEKDPKTREVQLEVDKYYKNHLFSIDFVDAYAPHIVFFPETFSITYALWSKDKDYISNKMKQKKAIQYLKKPLKWILEKTFLSSKFGVVGTKNLDFELKNNKCYLMPERVYGYTPSDNVNYIQNILHALQKIKFQNNKPLDVMKQYFYESNRKDLVGLVNKFTADEFIEDVFYEKHISVDERVNIPKKFVLSYFNLTERNIL